MSVFRRRILANLISVVLLSVFTLKAGALFIHHFAKSDADPVSMEKSAEEGKDTKEDSSDKSDKKILSYDGHSDLYAPLILINSIKSAIPIYHLTAVQEPHRTVPTPPPDFFA